MFPSLEVRWFYEGTIPPEVLEWFQWGEPKPQEQPSRADYYLRQADQGSVGIKLREGRIEIKQRQRQYGVVRFHLRVTGRVETWRKWSFELSEAGRQISRAAIPAPSWIGVKKERTVRRYQLTRDRETEVIWGGEGSDQACSLELTSIHVEGADWWSLGFEACAEELGDEGGLMRVARRVLTAHRPPSLRARDSYGYPEWLVTITQRR
jgi:hypothetical protein